MEYCKLWRQVSAKLQIFEKFVQYKLSHSISLKMLQINKPFTVHSLGSNMLYPCCRLSFLSLAELNTVLLIKKLWVLHVQIKHVNLILGPRRGDFLLRGKGAEEEVLSLLTNRQADKDLPTSGRKKGPFLCKWMYSCSFRASS